MSEERLWKFKRPEWMNNAAARSGGIYAAGGLFSLGFYLLLDAAVYSHNLNGSNIHITFIDWLPLIFSTLGMAIINSIEKARLSSEDGYGGFSGDGGVAWKARVVLFLGFAFLAGGVAGGISVLVLKYVVQEAEGMTLYMGVANLGANALVMASTVVLWVSQNMEDEYSYSLAL